MSLELLQDIHLSDDEFWTEFQYYWKNGNYSRALQILEENQELVTKYVSAEWFNSLTTFIYQLETLPDNFNKKQIKVSYLPPDLEVGDIWFQLELGEINIDVKMSIIPAGSTSVTTTYSNTLINALAFKNNEEVLVNQVINETNHSVTFSISESLDYPVICMVYYSNNSNLEINTINFSVGDEMFVVGYSGEILSVVCLQDNNKNIVNIYDYNSNELFFKMNPATENGIIRICSIPSANLNEILNVNSENLSGTVLRLTCDGYMVNSILTQAGTLELGINNVSESVVTFNDGVGGMALKSFSSNIEPVQDFHGYDHPWPAGGGKNLADPDKIYLMSIGSAAQGWIYVDAPNGVYRTLKVDKLSAGTYTISTTLNGNYFIRYRYTVGGSVVGINIQNESNNYTFTLTDDVTDFGISFRNASSTVITESFTVQLESGSTVTSFAPYSNICPISGWSAVNVWVKPTHDTTANPTVTIQLGQTVYNGTLDATNGVLTADMANIPSYNNESLPGEWISDRDVYAPGSIPTIGAQVVYELATPVTYQLTPTQINTLQGQNNIWADTGNISLEYYTASDSSSSTEELAVENFVLSDISFELNKAIISKDSNDSTINCILYYT